MKNEEKKTTAKTATAKPTTKSAKTTKAAAKSPAKRTASAKRTAAKPKPITIDNICGLVEKKIDKSKAEAISGVIAVDIEVWGFEDGSNHYMYIEIKDGMISVMPHPYYARDFRVSLSFTNALDFANGKITLAKLMESNDFYAEGNIGAAIKLASVF